MSFISRATPVDANIIFTNGMKAAETGDANGLDDAIKKLKKDFPQNVTQISLLDAMWNVGRNRPLKAVPLLQIAAEDASLKVKALSLLGSCFASAGDRRQALSILEQAVAADENADDARLNIVRILVGNLSWEEALTQSAVLVDHEAKLPEVHQLRADMFMELRQYADAAREYRASIDANRADPANGVKVSSLLQCLANAGDFSNIEELYEHCDTPSVRDCTRAEQLLSRGEAKEAITVLESTRTENANDPWLNRVYGRALLMSKIPEKAVEGVAVIQPSANIFTRDMKLWQVFGELASLSGDDRLAAVIAQNVDQMKSLDDQVSEKLASVIKTRDDVAARTELAELAVEAGRFDLARKAWEALTGFYPEREQEFEAKMRAMNVVPKPFFSLSATDTASPGP